MNSLRVQFDSDASQIILIPYIGSSAVAASFLHYIGFKSCNLTARKNKKNKECLLLSLCQLLGQETL